MTRGEYMRKARLDAGLSIVRLAEISGIAQTTISLLERKSLRGGWIDTISCLTQPNYLGRQLFCPTADKVLPDTPENKHSRKFLNGNV